MLVRSVLCALSVAGAFATLAPAASNPSRADFVTPGCKTAAFAPACDVAVRYLRALDLDRADEACRLLDAGTLQAAGGLQACTRMLLEARGIRIRYRVTAVAASLLGTTVRFSTTADGRGWLRQQMLVSPRGRIVAVVVEPW